MTETTTNKLVEVREGPILGTIWKNGGEQGTSYTVSFARLYKQGHEWRRGGSFRQGDLEALAKVVALAQNKISELSAADGQSA